MDLPSLPQEMLGSVLKYVPFDDLMKMRKVSSILDKNTRKYKLNHQKYKELKINAEDSSTKVTFRVEGEPFQEKFHEWPEKVSIQQILQYYFSRMRRLSVLSIHGNDGPDHSKIPAYAAELLMKYKKLKLSTIRFHKCELLFEAKLLNRILNTFPIKEFSLKAYINQEQYNPYKDELLHGLQLNSLTLISQGTSWPSELSLKSIEQLCAREVPKKLVIHKLNNNIYDLGLFLEQNVPAWVHQIEQWEFSVQPGALERGDARGYLENLKCFEKYKVRKLCQVLDAFLIIDEARKKRQKFIFINITY